MARLTERAVQTAKPGRHGDGDGLHLVVGETGRKKWVFRYQVAGARKDKGLGSYPDVGLKDARLKLAGFRRLIAKGIDPISADRVAKQAGRPLPTFEDVAKRVVEDARAKSVNAKVRYQWERHLGAAYCKDLLNRPVHEVTTLDVAATLRPVWKTKPEVARKLYPAIRRVFDRARIILRDEHGVAVLDNPARWDDLKAMGFEAPVQLSRGHHPSLHYSQMPAFVTELRARNAMAARALEFLTLTNVRTDAVLKVTWPEIDLEREVWTIPLTKLKDRKHRAEPFRVPLSSRAIEIVLNMQEVRSSDFVFPGPAHGKPFSNMAFLTLLKRMNVGNTAWIDPTTRRPITAHGFRATFRTWAEEVAAFPRAVIEQAMGHQIGNRVERAYRRTDVLEQRRALMSAWAKACEPRAASAEVVRLRQRV
jgi:integrase